MIPGNRVPLLALIMAYVVAGALLARPLLAAPAPAPASVAHPLLTVPQSSPTPGGSPGPSPAVHATPKPSLAVTATLAPTATPTPTPRPVRVLRSCPIDGDMDLLAAAPIHIVFDQPMDNDPSSVIWSITPTLESRVEWLAPEHLLVRTAPREAGVEYRIVLEAARSREGGGLERPLGLTFGQGGMGAPIPILMYHHIDPLDGTEPADTLEWTVSPQQFVAHLNLLEELGAHVVSLGEAVDYLQRGEPLPPRPVVLTFDDGNPCAYENAVPVLRERGLTATFFVCPAYIGDFNVLSWEQLRSLVEDGFTIGAHGYEHVKVHALSPAEAEVQFGLAKRRLEEETGAQVEFFAYPFGWFSRRAAAQLAAYGYRAALTINPWGYQKPADLMYLNRIRMAYGEPADELRYKLPW